MQKTTPDTPLSDYLDGPAADAFYFQVWGGEHLHVGIYESPEESIRLAGGRTVAHLANLVRLDADQELLDLGTAYGGGARYLSRQYGCALTCLHLTRGGFQRNERLVAAHASDQRIRLHQGNAEALPFSDNSFDIFWSTDTLYLLESPARTLQEAARVLRPGGYLVFTTPFQTDRATPKTLHPLLQTLPINGLPTLADYRKWTAAYGMREETIQEFPDQLRQHYRAVKAAIVERRDLLEEQCGIEYLAQKKEETERWIEATEQGWISWGLAVFKRS